MGAGVATGPHCPSRDYRRRDAMRPRSGLPGCGRDQARPFSGPGPVQAGGLGGSWFGDGGSRLPPVRRVLRSRSPSVPRLEMKQAPSLALRNRIRGSSSRRFVGARSADSPRRRIGPKPGAIGVRLESKQAPFLSLGADRSELRSLPDRTEIRSFGIGSKQAPPSALAQIEANSDPCPTEPKSDRSASGRSKLLPSAPSDRKAEAFLSSGSARSEANFEPDLVERTWRRFSLLVRHSCSTTLPEGAGAVGRLCKPGRSPSGYQNRPTRPADPSPERPATHPGFRHPGFPPSGYEMKALMESESLKADSACG